MLLIKGGAVQLPQDAQALASGVWSLAEGRSFGLFLLSVLGGKLAMGVNCSDVQFEERAAKLIHDAAGGTIESGDHIPNLIASRRRHLAAIRMVPKARDHHLSEWRTYGPQRRDPLKLTFQVLAGLDQDLVAGVGISVRCLPEEKCLTRLVAFASGRDAAAGVLGLVAGYGEIGVTKRKPLGLGTALGDAWSRSWVEEVFSSRGMPWTSMPVEEVSLFWHPPYDPTLRSRGI